MNLKPMMLFNPKNEEVEWMVDRRVYSLKPKESALFEGHVAEVALKYTNTGLEEYNPQEQKVEKVSGYRELPWMEFKKLAAKEGVFRTGVKRAEMERLLDELHRQGE